MPAHFAFAAPSLRLLAAAAWCDAFDGVVLTVVAWTWNLWFSPLSRKKYTKQEGFK
jgi:hypothetical protein